jgi:hypothetical protein
LVEVRSRRGAGQEFAEGHAGMKKTVNEIAQALSTSFQREIPNAGAGKKMAITAKQLEERLERFYRMVDQSKKEHRLGMLRWTLLLYRLQGKLNAAGYPADVVSNVVRVLLFRRGTG